MADNTQNQSPFDLGKIIIDGNSAMLNSGQNIQQNDPKNVLLGLLATTSATQDPNSPTGLPQAAIDAAAKVQKDYYTKHAQDVVDTHPDGIAILNQLINTHNAATQGSDSYTSSTQPKSQQTNTITPIQQNAMDIVEPQGVHPLGALLNLLGNVTGMRAANQAINSVQLGNLGKAQKITGQEPLQQKDIEQSALETQQKINQALMVPPTQAEKMSNAAAYAGYKTTALKDMLDNTDKTISQQNDILKNMQGYSSWFNKPFGAMPKEAQDAMKKMKQLQLERIGVASELNKHQQLLASGGVSKSPFIEGQIYTDANGNKATFKNGKFQ